MEKVKKYLNWNDIDNQINAVINKLESVRYDTILGLARGGMVPATVMSYRLNCNNLQQFGVRTRDVETIQYYGSPLLTGKVLVVDDINDSGLTFSSVDNYIRYHFDHNEIESITYSALYKRYNTKYKTSVYGEEIKNDDWLVFPWE